MALAQDIITRAYREVNITPIGIPPTTPQMTEGLTQLNVTLRILFGSKMGELLQDWEVPFDQRTAPVAANFPQNPFPINQDNLFMGLPLSGGTGTNVWPYPPQNSRLIFGATSNTTVYFPEQPNDGARMALVQGALATPGVVLTLDGNSRTINGALTATLTTPFTPTNLWLYRADLGDWRPILDLALTDTFPYDENIEDYMALTLAIRLAPKTGKTVSPETAAAYKAADTSFKARFQQAGTSTYGANEIPLGYQSFLSGSGLW